MSAETVYGDATCHDRHRVVEKKFVQHDWVECTGIVYAGTRLINKYEYTGNRCKAGNWLTGLQLSLIHISEPTRPY